MDQSCELVAWIHFCLPNIISSTNRPRSTSATRFAHGSATTNDSRATASTAATRGATRPTGGKGLQLLQAHGLVFLFSGILVLPFWFKPVWTGLNRIKTIEMSSNRNWKNGQANKLRGIIIVSWNSRTFERLFCQWIPCLDYMMNRLVHFHAFCVWTS